MFTELVVSNITRLIDLPGTELAQLMGEVDLKLPGGTGPASGFFRSLMSLKRKGRPGNEFGNGEQVSPLSFTPNVLLSRVTVKVQRCSSFGYVVNIKYCKISIDEEINLVKHLGSLGT